MAASFTSARCVLRMQSFWYSERHSALQQDTQLDLSRLPLCILLQSRRGSGFKTSPFIESNIIIREIIQSGVGIENTIIAVLLDGKPTQIIDPGQNTFFFLSSGRQKL